ncbi:hypothetical protein E0H39_03175 [Rhizobium leguminosarum bv. viciae]|uniref:Uncharacterized protein n=1 Tax=Rhizobium leguminosarum bv. viciae TaxID=387 RepID=A0A7G6RJ92_RHILV|nr:hypothetical protein [Rhizobium leguminosarum]ASS53110.1 hypothetical protein CHR56_00035 [Rhizobium leguminosarum bv. viciae]ASS57614.1 hypothetical protein CHR56_25370 [Rhizobium leguminosarum bv. viciae]ASS60528.1 hypothetical protein CHR56_39105 [Rhizobium leguminosarum bv. viciae]QND42324.1 hypothetical protein HB770_10925 [Rhizobium leguminosarum bv. viciae]TBY17464.1 hypothetical protein E0H30_25925 [Rhizobium leguminosarum bv. viciae]
MQYFRNIETEQSKRDARWNAARTIADCNAYMAIEAQSHARLAAPFIESNMWRGPNWLRGVTAARSERYRYAREIMNIRDEDQLYA